MIDSVRVLDAEPLRLACEPLLLNASDIEHICLPEDILDAFALLDYDTSPACCGDDGRWHSERCRRDEIEADAVHAKESHKTVDRTSILEVTKKSDGAAINGTQLGTDGVYIQKCLWRL